MASTINASNSGFGGIVSTGDSSGQLQLQTASTTAVTIDTSQNVGIGTTSPTSKLTVSNAPIDISDGYGLRWGGSSNNAYVAGYTSNLLTFITNATERMRIDSSGNVGIGVTPSSWGSGSQAIQNSSGCIWQYGSSNIYLGANYYFNGTNRIYKNSDYATEYQQGAGLHRWFSAASGTAGNTVSMTEVMRIDANGDIEIGKTDGSQNTQGIILNSYGTGRFTATAQQAMHMNRLTSDGQIVAFYRSSSQVGNISVTTSATTYNSGSDYRLKEDILPMINALDKVALLKPVTFKWKIDGSNGQGFIAHELAEVIPDAVTGTKDAIDAEGNPDYQSVDPRMIVATLTAAIQELKEIVDTQAERIKALEAK